MKSYFKTPEAALQYCNDLCREKTATYFRGQNRDWPKILPSIMRPLGVDRDIATGKLSLFLNWARNVPQMFQYDENDDALIAIAQHYGIPTNFLDLTTDPQIAVFFAKNDGPETNREDSVIYCFDQQDLESLNGAHVINLDVHNLWRLEAQSGVFLAVDEEAAIEGLKEIAHSVYFPSGNLSLTEKVRLYPVRKSALEIVIDQYFYRIGIDSAIESFRDIKFKMMIRRQTYPGVFRWRKIPPFEADWLGGDGRWLLAPPEKATILQNPMQILIRDIDTSDPKLARRGFEQIIAEAVRTHEVTGRLLTFSIELSAPDEQFSGSASVLLNRCWDGIRLLPFSIDEKIACVAATGAFLVARARKSRDVDGWDKLLWGEMELIEVAPIGGHIGAGVVSKIEFRGALDFNSITKMTKYMQRIIHDNIDEILMYVVDPHLIFDFNKLKKIFCTQFLPSAINGYWKEDIELCAGALGCLWSPTFNPALLGYLTIAAYRFTSPVASEHGCPQIVFVFPDMLVDDVTEAFVSCLPSIIERGVPFQVKFHGYSTDPRPVWEIPQVVEKARWIIECGGISVLEVFTSMKAPDGQDDEFFASKREMGGMGAFEIWLLSKELIGEMQGKEFLFDSPLFRDFQADLLASNAKIENLARQAPDWPMPAWPT